MSLPDFINQYIQHFGSKASVHSADSPLASMYIPSNDPGTGDVMAPLNPGYKGILAHELAHSTSPIVNFLEKYPGVGIPVAVASTLAVPGFMLTSRQGLPGAAGAPGPDSWIGNQINKLRSVTGQPLISGEVNSSAVRNVLSKHDPFVQIPAAIGNKKVLYGLLAAYAPRFAEETLSNIRAGNALFQNESLGEALTNLPQLLLSQASYTLPLAVALYAHKRLNAPVGANATFLNRLRRAASSVKTHADHGAWSPKHILETIKLNDAILRNS